MESEPKTPLTQPKDTPSPKHIQFSEAGSELLLLARQNTAKIDAASIYLGQSSHAK